MYIIQILPAVVVKVVKVLTVAMETTGISVKGYCSVYKNPIANYRRLLAPVKILRLVTFALFQYWNHPSSKDFSP